jgi:hypothetical protein
MSTKLAEVCNVFREAAQTLVKQAERIEYLEGQLAQKNIRSDAEKLASTMREKGVDSGVPLERLVVQLEKMASEHPNEYSQFKGSVDLVGPDMCAKMAHLTSDESTEASGSTHEFVRFIEGQLS